LGKLNTVVQIFGLVAVLAERSCMDAGWAAAGWLSPVTSGILRVIAVLAPVSAAQYGWVVLRRIDTPTAV
jgi:cardiolipin synthase